MRGPVATDLVDRQHGVVARRQLLALGVGRRVIDRDLEAGRLRLLYRGVYAVGHEALRVEGRWMAATLAAGEGAVLSHQTAAAAWDLRRSDGSLIHVTVPTDAGRRRLPGVRVHRSRTLTARAITTRHGIPITTPARTIIDLAATTHGRALERLINRAERLVDFDELRQAPRTPSLQAVLATYTSPFTRSELEERFLQLCDDHGIPRPQVNARVDGYEVDFLWRDRKLIVELDGYEHHRSPAQFERDRHRDVTLAMKGFTTRRFTYGHVTRRAAWVAKAVRA